MTIEALDEPLTLDNIDRAKGADTVSLAAVVPVPDKVLDALHAIDVNVISQRSAGVDKYSLDKLNELGMTLINVPRYLPNAIAEYVVSSALYFTRNLNNIYRNVEKHDFRWQVPILSREMHTLTVSIVGVGNIGRAAAKLFHGLSANVIGYAHHESDEMAGILDYVDLDKLYAKSDVITFHVPGTDANYHLVNDESIAKMKDGVVLINASRGTVVDTEAVLRALDSHKIKGAALDVYENEGEIVNHDLTGQPLNDDLIDEIIQRDDIVYTPHIAFYTETALDNLLSFALDESIKFIETGESGSVVNK